MNLLVKDDVYVVIALINVTAIIIHIIIDEKHKKLTAQHFQVLNECFRELVKIDNSYLPWMWEKLNEEEKQVIRDTMDNARG